MFISSDILMFPSFFMNLSAVNFMVSPRVPASIFWLKDNNANTRTMFEIYSS